MGFCQIPGSRDFLGLDLPLYKVKKIFENFAILAIFGVRAFQGVQDTVTKKSRDFSFKNPRILADLKSRDPARACLCYKIRTLKYIVWIDEKGQNVLNNS